MKAQLRKIFAPLLSLFEQGNEYYVYKPSHRTILKIMGGLFIILSSGSLSVAILSAMWAGLLPGLVFFSVGFVCLIVGFLGTDQAVARIWKNR